MIERNGVFVPAKAVPSARCKAVIEKKPTIPRRFNPVTEFNAGVEIGKVIGNIVIDLFKTMRREMFR